MSFFTFLLLAFAVGDVAWWVRSHRRLRGWPGRLAAAAFALLMLGGLALIVGGRWLGLAWSETLPRPVLSAIYLWHLLFLPLWLLLAVASGLVIGARHRFAPPQVTAAPGVTRREFLGTAASLAPAALALGGAAGAEAQLEHFRIRRLEVPLANLPPGLDGLTLAHVTDVHVGRFTRAPVLERIVAQTNALEADLVLMTGDLINYSLRDLPAAIDLVRGLRGRHGVFLCEGNHDLFDDAAAFRRGLERAGLGLLRDEAHPLAIHGARLQVFGLPWTHGDAAHAAVLARARQKIAPGAFPILLGHHPHIFDHAEGFPLTLAGHTHGGQLMLTRNLGGGPALFRYWSGLYERAGRTLAVANGVGNWFPLRLGAPAEILHLTLRKS